MKKLTQEPKDIVYCSKRGKVGAMDFLFNRKTPNSHNSKCDGKAVALSEGKRR